MAAYSNLKHTYTVIIATSLARWPDGWGVDTFLGAVQDGFLSVHSNLVRIQLLFEVTQQ